MDAGQHDAEHDVPVAEIPRPWRHPYGQVVDVEYPAGRPRVVDLVFADGTRTAETKTARYSRDPAGVWDIAQIVAEHGHATIVEGKICGLAELGQIMHGEFPDHPLYREFRDQR